jgi:O-antigen/teichoic acid export membrane protein
MQNWKTILTNFASLSGGELLSKMIAFITTIYLARIILPEGFGIVGYSTAFVSYFLLFVDFGFDVISVKHIANDKSLISKYINNIISFRILLASIIFIILLIIVSLLNENLVVKIAILITGGNLFVQALSTEFVFQATEKIKYLSIKVVAKNILILLFVLLFVKDFSDVLIVVGISVVANLILNIWLLKKYNDFFNKYKWMFNKEFLRKLFVESFPLIISSFMISIYYNLDMVMLGNMKNQADVGVYNAAYKIFMIGLIPLASIIRVFLPSLSKVKNPFILRRTIKNYGILMFGSGIVISFLIFTTANSSINFIFGSEYTNAIFPLMILALNILVISVNIFFGNPLTVWGKQKEYSIAITFGAVANIFLNILLIPKYSINGAAFATFLSEVVVFIGVFYLFNKNYKVLSRER